MLKKVTLEMSLKPFRSASEAYVEEVCRKVFTQWKRMTDQAASVGVMLWVGDGSELLDYRGELDEEMEWARYIGGANPREGWDKRADPEGIALHTRCYLYTEEPPALAYRDLKNIIAAIKRVGNEVTGKPVFVGETFDPGPEFAKSDFKYNRHNEVCEGASMGRKSMVCCYHPLHGDRRRYAAFPDGIPEGTPFGAFLGRQSEAFLKDMGFDYLWLSNGFGFGTEAWGTKGALFDGERFFPEKLGEVREKILGFWRLFRAECSYPVETRGTNLTAGIDLATDGVDIKGLYGGGFGLLPPPNSPWAALDGDFGLELAGYLSRMAELPDDENYLFRFYIHDPWWVNSPWLDRYGGMPHDLYLPLSASRIDGKGRIGAPTHINLLTVDNSFGETPDRVPDEVLPHLMTALRTLPDAPSPLVWVYPFREYSELVSGRAGKPFFEDWFIRGAINHGLPLSTVVSTDVFLRTLAADPGLYDGSILVLPVPASGEELSGALIRLVREGKKILLYGSTEGADPALLALLGLEEAEPLEGELTFRTTLPDDLIAGTARPDSLLHDPLMSDGPIATVSVHGEAEELVSVFDGEGRRRTAGSFRAFPGGGQLVWLRGTNCSRLGRGHILEPYDQASSFPFESLPRLVLERFGYSVLFEKYTRGGRDPVFMLSRQDNAFLFSGYSPDTTTGVRFRFPLGAPLLLGSEAWYEDGYACYRFGRAWRHECRVFVTQEEKGVLSYKEMCPVSYVMERRVSITGLSCANLVVFPRKGYESDTEVLVNPLSHVIVGEPFEQERIETPWGPALAVKGVSGTVVISDKRKSGVLDRR